METTNKIAKIKFTYHNGMASTYSILNKMGVLKNNRAEIMMWEHRAKAFGLYRQYDVRCK